MAPKFSIIIPVYNVAPYLRECLDSVLAQTYTDWEAICIDDGSTDDSGEILDEYAAKDQRFRVIHQVNAGVSASRNVAIDLVQGDYIQFIDADDHYPDDGTLKIFSDAIADSNKVVIFGSVEMFYADTAKKEVLVAKKLGTVRFRDIPRWYGFQCCAIKRSVILENNIKFPSLSQWEDPVFLIDVLIAAKEYYNIPEVVYSYRMRQEGNGVNWMKDNGRPLKEFLSGIILGLERAKTFGMRELYVDIASQLGLRESFSEISHFEVAKNEVERFTSDIKTSGKIRFYEWAKILRGGVLCHESKARKFWQFYRLFGMMVAISISTGSLFNKCYALIARRGGK